jgi:hypothetical protein
MHAAKKYQVRKEARKEFRIEDTDWLRGGGWIVAWVVNGPRQSEVPSLGRRVRWDCL